MASREPRVQAAECISLGRVARTDLPGGWLEPRWSGTLPSDPSVPGRTRSYGVKAEGQDMNDADVILQFIRDELDDVPGDHVDADTLLFRGRLLDSMNLLALSRSGKLGSTSGSGPARSSSRTWTPSMTSWPSSSARRRRARVLIERRPVCSIGHRPIVGGGRNVLHHSRLDVFRS